MKIFAIFAIGLLLAGTATAALEDPDNLEIYIKDYGFEGAFCCWQNQTTGIWSVVYIDPAGNSKYFTGNATGTVVVT